MVETVSKIIGSELIWLAVFRSRKEVIIAIGEYIDDFYNRVRRHAAHGYKSPIQFAGKKPNLKIKALPDH